MISSLYQLPARTVTPKSAAQQEEAASSVSAADTLLGAASAAVDEAFKAGDAIGAIVVLAQQVSRAGTVYEVFNAISAYTANGADCPAPAAEDASAGKGG